MIQLFGAEAQSSAAFAPGTQDSETVRSEVGHAMDVLGITNRFILHPVDLLYPDMRWEGLATMIKTWKTYLRGDPRGREVVKIGESIRFLLLTERSVRRPIYSLCPATLLSLKLRERSPR
jgi:hypothetical protein